MTPEEVVEVARSLSSPVLLPEGGFKGAELKRRKSAGAGGSRRAMGLGMSMSSIGSSTPVSTSTSPEVPPIALEPVEYVQMDEDTLLPFVDRPAEVSELIKHHSNEKMFNLLRAAFPKHEVRDDWKDRKPEEWSWDEFILHLTIRTRDEVGDYNWVYASRQAVRARSVALWEKVGTCLGCDGDLLNVGGEDGGPVSWGGLGLGEEGEYDGSGNQVWIEGIEAVDAASQREMEKSEDAFREQFGDIVEDEDGLAQAGMTALLGGLSESIPITSRPTTAQRAGSSDLVDPMNSPGAQFQTLPTAKSLRSKSFVGLQILTSPKSSNALSGFSHSRSPSQGNGVVGSPMMSPSGVGGNAVFERGPGSPLFPSSFSSLSVEPNLGRSASVGLAGMGGGIAGKGRHGVDVGMSIEVGGEEGAGKRWRGLARKPSGAGLSESG
jgi:hypothetical protein